MCKFRKALECYPFLYFVFSLSIALYGSSDPNILKNGSFEIVKTEVHSLPEDWVIYRGSRDDFACLKYNPLMAHSGNNYVRLSSPRGTIEFHCLPHNSPISLKPGQRYTIRLWARSASDKNNAKIFVEPGRFKSDLTSVWKLYRFSYVFPKDAHPELGFFFRAKGDVDIDDVSMVSEGQKPVWSKEIHADRLHLNKLPVEFKWRIVKNEPAWQLRVPIIINEVMGKSAKDYVIKLKLNKVLTGIVYEKLCTKNLILIDACNNSRKVKFGFIDSDRCNSGLLTPYDEITFKVSCPARSQKIYFLYYAPQIDVPVNRSIVSQEDEDIDIFEKSSYPYKLDCIVGKLERRTSINYSVDKIGHLNITVISYSAKAITGQLISPDGKTKKLIPLTKSKDKSYLWKADNITLTSEFRAGVSQIVLNIKTFMGTSEQVHRNILTGPTIWWRYNVQQILLTDEPEYGKQCVRICAARNEGESFQIAIGSDVTLSNVKLSATNLVSINDKNSIIEAQRFTFKYIENLPVTMPWFGGSAGLYPDPLVPWRVRNISGGKIKTALVIIQVPKTAKAGLYRGNIIARWDEGKLELPIKFEVFNFCLPDKKHFTLILGGDIWTKVKLGYHKPEGKINFYNDIANGRAVFALARILAEHYATPFYYHHDKSPYAIPWHYSPRTEKAEFDFKRLDINAKIMLEEWKQSYLFFGGKFAASHGKRTYRVWDWIKDLKKAWNADWEMAVYEHYFNVTPENVDGQKMYRAFCKALAEHLKDKGWLNRSYIYIVDEDKTDVVRNSARCAAKIAKQSGLKTFAAGGSSALFRWPVYLDFTDAYAGVMSDGNLRKFKSRGGKYWGKYNSIGLINSPLSYTRMISLKSWLENSSAYFNWAIYRAPDSLINTAYYWKLPANAGYSAGTFIKGVSFFFGSLGTLVYPIPQWEPIPEDTTQKLFIGSLRLEALRESVEDYEYVYMLEKLAESEPKDANGFTEAEYFLLDIRSLLKRDRVKFGKWIEYYNVDELTYQKLRRRIGRYIGKTSHVR